jgi:CHAT domain-containing protein
MEEVDYIVQVFSSSGWLEENIVCLRGSEATMDCVSNALDTCSWVHFACHAIQDPPSFLLHDGHLRLSEIASKRLSMGQFAFLSACHAAAGITMLPGEAMHLAAGL